MNISQIIYHIKYVSGMNLDNGCACSNQNYNDPIIHKYIYMYHSALISNNHMKLLTFRVPTGDDY